MKQRYLLFFGMAAAILSACGTTRKAAIPKTATVTPPPPPVAAASKPSNGVYAPGEAELTAIRATGSSVTMETLSEGYKLYTGDACTRCHGVKGIYSRPGDAWPGIVDDMSSRAKLTGMQKEALLKYVLAIKATQGK